jgi:hypothetical protein
MAAQAQLSVSRKALFLSDGPTGQVGWSSWGKNNVILYSRWGGAKFDLYKINPDGTGNSCLTCSLAPPLVSGLSSGTGSFHPDGDYIVFSSQRAGGDPTTSPGAGSNYDVWIADYPVTNAWKITDIALGQATLWPKFSASGARVAWTEAYQAPDADYPIGKWRVKVGTFTKGNPPTVTNIQSYEFGPEGGIYEIGDFEDDTYLYVTGCTEPGQIGGLQYAMDIHRLNVTDGTYTRVTNYLEFAWDEFARVTFNGLGPKILWGSTRAFTEIFLPGQIVPRIDVWAMAKSGTSLPRRLTFCNSADDPMFNGEGVATACVPHGLSPDNSQLLVQNQTESGRSLWILDLQWFPVSVSATSTQAVLSYPAPDDAPCALEVGEQADYSLPVHDVNPSLFPGSNLDSREGNFTAGRSRIAVVGQRTTGAASDQKKYSRALQADTTHYYRVTCNRGIATGSFRTATIPLGSTRSDALEPDPDRPGYLLWPTKSLATDAKVIDPHTGLLFKRYVKAGATYAGTTGATAVAVAADPAPAGANWTNPENVTADDGLYASYSGASRDWLVLSLDGQYPDSSTKSSNELSYLNLFFSGYCSGPDCAAGGQTMEVCVTRDGVNCEAPIRQFDLGTQQSTISVCGSSPCVPKTAGDVFTHEPISKTDWKLADGRIYNTPENPTKLFFTRSSDCGRLRAGEQIWFWRSSQSEYKPVIQSLSCGANPPEATVDTGIDVTHNGTTGIPFYYPYGIKGNKRFGVMVRKKSASAASTINLDYVSWKAASYATGPPSSSSGGFHKVCTNKPTANGFYHCSLYGMIYGVRPEADGDLTVRFLGNAYYAGDAAKGIGGGAYTECNATGSGDWLWDDEDPNVMYCNGRSSQVNPETGQADNRPIIVKLSYTGNDVECGSGGTCPAADPEGGDFERWPKLPGTIENLTPCVSPCTQASDDYAMTSQMKRYTASKPFQYDQAGFPGCQAQSVQDGYMGVTCLQGAQDSYGWLAGLDLGNKNPIGGGYIGRHGNTQQIIAANPVFNRTSSRWCTIHTYQNMGYGPILTGEWQIEKNTGFQVTASNSLSACNKLTGTCDPCPAVTVDGFDYGGRNWCGTLNVISTWNPSWGAAPAAYTPGDPLSDLWNLHWLRPAEAGDVFRHSQGGSEYVKIIRVDSPTQWVVERGYGADQTYLYPRSHDSGVAWTADCTNDINPLTTLNLPGGSHWYFLDDPDGTDPASYFISRYVNHALARPPSVRVRPDYSVSRADFTDKAAMAEGSEARLALPSIFAGKLSNPFGNAVEKHPGYSQVNAPGFAKRWFLDINPYLFTSNSSPATWLSGDLYRYNLYPGKTVDPKQFAIFGMAGFHGLRDLSGPGSALADDASASFKLCYAHRAGECRPGSQPGEIFFNVPNLDGAENHCKEGEFYSGWHDICIGNFAAIGNATTQWTLPESNHQYLPNGVGTRVLSRLWHDYRNLAVTSNAKATPDGSWFLGRHEYLGKLPWFPPVDSVNRATFVPVRIQIKPPSGAGADNAVVEFGYNSSFYCTTRAESCVKDSHPSEPYVFAGDVVSGIPCANGCTVDIPAHSQKVLYYRWVYRNASGEGVGTGSTNVIVVP